jgi:beta-lactamase regulating signal transducer with metallopeptidase domain
VWLSRCGSHRKRVNFAVSNDIATPVAVGFTHPMILFPATLALELDAACLDGIGQHEAGHLARYDDVAILAQRIAQAVFPWNPACMSSTVHPVN